MKNLFKAILFGIALSACNNSTITSEEVDEASNESNNESVISNEIDDEDALSIESDCIFDLTTQNDDFIKNVPEFSNYVWDDSTKSAHITLANGEKIIATKGGCNHFGISGTWIQENKKHPLEEVDYWLEQGKWISKRIMTENDYSELTQMIDNETYEINIDDNRLFILFENQNYSEWYLSVNRENNNEKDIVTIETGYYFD